MTATILETDLTATSAQVSEPRTVGRLRLVVIGDTATMRTVREPWNELAGQHPFMRWEWIASWWQTFRKARQAAVLTVRDEDGRWVGLFPLQIERRPFSGRVLSNLANGRACSDHVRPVIAAGYERAVLRLMANWINKQAERGEFDLIDFDGVDAADWLMEPLLNELVQMGMKRHDTEIEGSWIAELPSTWSAFEQKTKKCFRRKLQKARRNLVLPGIEIETVSSSAALREHWSTLIQLHEARRDAKEQIGCFQENGFAEFLLQAASRMADRGDAVLLLAKLDGKPFGAILLFFAGDRAHMYQSGFDPAQRHLEPGHLMATCALQHAIERQLTHFDFLRGDEPYKERWNTVRQPMNRIRLVPNRSFARLRMWLWLKQQAIKSRLGRSAKPQPKADSEESNQGTCIRSKSPPRTELKLEQKSIVRPVPNS